eukprot:gene10273-12025_t
MVEVDEHRDVDLADETEKYLIQLVVNFESADTLLRNCAQHMRVGTSVQCTGTAKFDRPGCLSIYVLSVRILKCSAKPDAIMRFISDDFTNRELNVCEALGCTELQFEELRALVTGGATKAKQLKQAIAKHSRIMVGKPSRRSRQREHRVSKPDLDILDKLESSDNDDILCESRNPAGESDSCGNQQLLNLPGDHTAPSSRGPMSRGEYMHGRKQPQIRWLVKKLSTMGPFMHVLDIGGGRGDLAVLIAQTFPHTLVTVVDANLSSLRQGKAFAKRCGEEVYTRIRFVCARFEANFSFEGVHILSDADLDESENSNAMENSEQSPIPQLVSSAAALVPMVDVVVALHACGGLSDLAVHYAAIHQSRFLSLRQVK